MTSATCSRLAKLWPLAKTSTCGSAAAMPRRVECAREARQPRAEGERLEVPIGPHGGMRERDEGPRIRGHRARDVEQKHQPAAPKAALPPGQRLQLAAGAERPPERSAQ